MIKDLIKDMKPYPILRSYPKCIAADLPDLGDFCLLAQKTIDGLPEKFRKTTNCILIKIENFADQETLDSLNIKDKYDLLGLYRGTPMPVKNQAFFSLPDTIFLYRCPLIRYARDNNEKLESLVHHVMIHEIGHHFGFSDQDLSWIESEAGDN